MMMTGRTISHFQVLEKLGGGGMGVVYLAEDMQLDRTVALKFLPPHLSADEEANQRFVQEAKAASALNHPNVCTIHEIGQTDDGQTFIAMAFYEGETLKQKLASGRLSTEEAAEIARQVAEGLEAAHEQGIIHRDIKPANIFITKRGRAVILDFGLAKLTGSLDLTKSGSTLGTAYYMSPEQIRGDEVDHRTDIWSLGVVLYEMLAGRRPFVGDYEQAISYAILNEEPERLAKQTAIVEGIVHSCLKKKSSERAQDAATLAKRLQTVAGATTGAVATRPTVGRTPWVIAAGVVVVAAVLALLLVPRLTSDGGAEEPTVLEGLVVMPFTVRGDESLEYLSEGMVDLLSLSLDGVGGRRAVDPRLVFAEVNRTGIERNDLPAALSVANRLGARDLIMGTVMRVGPHIRFAATQYDSDGDAVVRAEEEVEEGSDDPMPAIDRLTQSLVASYVGEKDQGRLSVAAMTTSSIEALKAYLEGEESFRGGRYQDARLFLQRALDLDSTFALAWYRLGVASGWLGSWHLYRLYTFKANEYSDGLPERIQRFLRAEKSTILGAGEEAERLYRSLTQEYPADALAWYHLADYRYHLGPSMGYSVFRSKDALERALVLDPGNVEILEHLIAIAIIERRFLAADSLLDLSSPDWDRRSLQEMTLALARSSRQEARDSLVQVASRHDWGWWIAETTRHSGSAGALLPGDEELMLGERIYASRMKDTDLSREHRIGSQVAYALRHLFRTGRMREVRDDIETAEGLEVATVWHIAVSPLGALLEGELEGLRARIETEPVDRGEWTGLFEGQEEVFRSFQIGMLSIRMNDWPEVERQVRFLDEVSEVKESAFASGFSSTLKAFVARKNGESEAALQQASRVVLPLGERDWVYGRAFDRELRAEVLMELGRYREAIELWETLAYTHALWQVPTYLYRAQCYEALGNTDQAIALYQLFADLWKDADAELQPMVEEARAGHRRLFENQIREPS